MKLNFQKLDIKVPVEIPVNFMILTGTGIPAKRLILTGTGILPGSRSILAGASELLMVTKSVSKFSVTVDSSPFTVAPSVSQTYSATPVPLLLFEYVFW